VKTIQVTVKPNSRVSQLEESDGTWIARVKSPPVNGKANREMLSLIAAHFGVPRSRVAIKSGAGARIKRVQVDEK
ncbi:MAG TPA: DUF167 domain-containing protein, partial [Woeseiaceae bacterium]|nr:DUF167 domain-containing protein [Woeseiaceae bacterium]